MKLIDKLKNIFFEEVEEDEEEEELPQTFAKKVEIPKKKEIEIPKREVEETIKVEPKIEEPKEEEFPMMFDDDDFLEDKKSFKEENTSDNLYKREKQEYEERELYQGKKEMTYVEKVNNKPVYSHTKSYYEERDTKGFRPSPIISPIYGILDKNYHKEEVITKRETRITSSYNKPDLDSIRNKAFGSDEVVASKGVREEKKEDTKIYDVNNNKPQVNRVTLADADEYYNDLGLAYNEDYSDASRTNTRTSKYNPKDKKKNNVDDNLFDLIDSMYSKEE